MVMNKYRKHLFLVDKFDNHKRHVFYMSLGIKEKGLDVIAFWLDDREIERDFISYRDFWKYDFENTTFECLLRNVIFYDRHEKIGWLQKDGRFYPCGMCNHSKFAYWYFGKEEGRLETEGFVKVAYYNDLQNSAYNATGIITEAQYLKLKSLGFSDEELADLFSVVN